MKWTWKLFFLLFFFVCFSSCFHMILVKVFEMGIERQRKYTYSTLFTLLRWHIFLPEKRKEFSRLYYTTAYYYIGYGVVYLTIFFLRFIYHFMHLFFWKWRREWNGSRGICFSPYTHVCNVGPWEWSEMKLLVVKIK